MRNVFRGACVVSMLLAVVACDQLKQKLGGGEADAAAEAAAAVAVDTDAAAVPVPTPAVVAAATNENDIARFPDEKKLENVSATVLRAYSVREAPPAGKVIGTLPVNTAVTQVAQRGTYFIILFDDAKAPGTKLMGWVHQDAFTAAPPADAGVALACTAPDIALMSDSAFCGRQCTKDADCVAGQACKGAANKLVNGKMAEAVTVCTVFHAHDAGAPAPTPAADAGLKGLIVNAIDAGKPAVDPNPKYDVVDAVGGACPANYVLVSKDKRCHKRCPKPADCRAAYFCGVCDGTPTCNPERNFCAK